MKVKNLFITFGLSLALGVVAAVGAGQKAEKAEAAQTSWYVVGSFNGVNKWSHTTGYAMTNTEGDTWVYENLSFAAGDEFKICDETDGSWQGGWSFNNGSSSAAIKDIFSAENDGSNIVCGTAGVYTVTFTKNDWKIKIEPGSVPTYTVSKYAVVNGVAEVDPFATDVEPENTVYATPARANRKGYHFGGWFTTSACNVAFEGATLTSNISIFAKYTSLVNDSYIYYITGSEDPTTNYIYSFGGDNQFGTGTGSLITSVGTEVHNVVRFQNVSQCIYKIPFSTTAGDTHIIINKNAWGGDNQTSDMLLVEGSAYWWSKDADYHNDDAGAALDFIFAVEAKRNAVTASGSIKEYSICGISSGDALTLCNAYNALTKEQREDYVDISYTYTYKRTDSSQNDNVSFYDIMEQLAKQAGGVALTGHSASRLVPVSSTGSSNAVVIIIVIVASLSLITIAGCFLIKRKHN